MFFISKKEAVRKAVYIGGMCSISYLAVYIARNILGTVSPELIKGDIFTEGQIGTLSSIYFICYGIGQLINGAIGDKIKAKYMISAGLCLAGVCNLLFALAKFESAPVFLMLTNSMHFGQNIIYIKVKCVVFACVIVAYIVKRNLRRCRNYFNSNTR